MKLNWKFIAVFFFATIIPAAAQQAAPEKTLTAEGQSVVSAEKDLIAARKKGDARYLRNILTDDFSYVGIDGQLLNRREALDELGGTADLMTYNLKVVSVTDSVAIVTYDVIVRVPPVEDQGPPPRYQHISSVWSKQGDSWKLKFQQTTASHWGDW